MRKSSGDTSRSNNYKSKVGNIKEFSEKEFKEFISGKKTGVAVFSATWCGACQMVTPILEKLAKTYEGLTFFKIDVSKSPEVSSKMGVMSIPNIMFFQKGNVIEQIIGAASESDLEKRIKKLI